MIHWTIPFKGLDGSSYMINIHDSSYSGSPVTLTGGAEPFMYSEDDSDDFFSPIRSQNGYIRVVADDSWSDGIFPSNKYDRKVEVTKNGELQWRGYIKPEVYSQAWEAKPYEIELAVQSQLACIVTDKSQVSENRRKVLDIIYDMFRTAEYSSVVFPHDWSTGDTYPMRTLAVTIQRADEDSLMDNESFLEDFLNFWSLQLREYRDTLYFVGRHGCQYNKWSWSAFWQDGSPYDEYYYSNIPLRNLSIAGNKNQLSILQPYRQIRIKAVCGNDSKTTTGIEREKMTYSGVTKTSIGSVYLNNNNRLRKIYYRPNKANVSFFSYINKKSKYGEANTWEQQTWNPDDVEKGSITSSAGWARCDCYKQSDIDNGDKRSYNYKDTLILRHSVSYFEEQAAEHGDYNYPTYAEQLQYPLARITFSQAFYATDGAFCIKGQFDFQSTAPLTSIIMTLRCGNYYWNGSTWGTARSLFSVALDGQSFKNTKTINDLYENADGGYMVPITLTLFGKLELEVLMSDQVCGYHQYATTFELQYCPVETATTEKKEDESITYMSPVQAKSTDDIEQEIGMASFVSDTYGLGTLALPNGNPLTTLYPNYGGGAIRPEQGIISLAKTELSSTRRKINVECRETDILPVQQLTYNNRVYNINSFSRSLGESVMTLNLVETHVTQIDVPKGITTRAEVEQCVSEACKSLWGDKADITLGSFKNDRFCEWLYEIGEDTQLDGSETEYLRQELYYLYPELSGTMVLPDDREDTFSGYDIINAICQYKGIS